MVYIYDLEVYPNFFSACFVSKDNDDPIYFRITPKRNDLKALIDFMNQGVILVGFNNHHYDDPLLESIVRSKISNNDLIFDVSQSIITGNKKANLSKGTIDLMKLWHLDRFGVSLKHCGVVLQWKKIQDLPYHFSQALTEEQMDEVLEYNLNDVLITKELFKKSHEKLNLRKNLQSVFNINGLWSLSDSAIADRLMTKFYADYSGLEIEQFRYSFTEHKTIRLSECIPNIDFKLDCLKQLYQDISNQEVDVSDGKKPELNFYVDIDGLRHSIALGGLHSENKPEIIIPKSDETIIDADAASYYPRNMINHKFCPRHLDEDIFIRILSNVTEERIQAKKTNPPKAEGLKITINSVFGKSGSEFGFLRDKKVMYKTTLHGQLYLLKLIESLHFEGIRCIYSNTDGITCLMTKDKVDTYYKVCKDWEEAFDHTLEFVEYEKMILEHVNSYLIVYKNDDKFAYKQKSTFSEKLEFHKGYFAPVITKALNAYYINDTPIIDFLKDHKNIMDFCISQRIGGQFSAEYHWLDPEKAEHHIDKLQKTNRYFISKNGGHLYKAKPIINKTSGKEAIQRINLVKGYKVTLFNDYFDATDYQIDYSFYEFEAYKIIYKLENNFQQTLF